jgi:hypothetical protein
VKSIRLCSRKNDSTNGEASLAVVIATFKIAPPAQAMQTVVLRPGPATCIRTTIIAAGIEWRASRCFEQRERIERAFAESRGNSPSTG